MEPDNNNQSDPTSEKSLIVRVNTNNLTTSKNTNPLISRAVNDALEIAIRSTRSVGRMAGVEAATASNVPKEVAKASIDTVGPAEGAKAANHTVGRAKYKLCWTRQITACFCSKNLREGYSCVHFGQLRDCSA